MQRNASNTPVNNYAIENAKQRNNVQRSTAISQSNI